jgi:hypothetical protein
VGTVSDALEKAAQDAVAAADNTELVRTIAAILAVQQATQQQPPAPQPARSEFDSKKWVTIGGLVVAGGGVACFLALAAAILAVGVAIGGTCATACLLVLRSMWRDIQKGR